VATYKNRSRNYLLGIHCGGNFLSKKALNVPFMGFFEKENSSFSKVKHNFIQIAVFERNPYPAKNQTPRPYRVYISPRKASSTVI